MIDFGLGMDDEPEEGETQAERDGRALQHVRNLFTHQYLDMAQSQHSWPFVWEQFQALRHGRPDMAEDEVRSVLRRHAGMTTTLATATFGGLWLDWDDLTHLANQGLLEKVYGGNTE